MRRGERRRADPATMCEGKSGLDAAQAHEIASAMRSRHKGQRVTSYRCPCCGRWHVGRSNASR